jgi:integrase
MHIAKMILRYALDTDVIKKSPAAKIKTAVSARHKRQPDIPSREELRMILSAPAGQNLNKAGKFGHRRDTLDFTLGTESGLRPCERRALAWAQVDLVGGRVIVLRDVKKDNHRAVQDQSVVSHGINLSCHGGQTGCTMRSERRGAQCKPDGKDIASIPNTWIPRSHASGAPFRSSPEGWPSLLA